MCLCILIYNILMHLYNGIFIQIFSVVLLTLFFFPFKFLLYTIINISSGFRLILKLSLISNSPFKEEGMPTFSNVPTWLEQYLGPQVAEQGRTVKLQGEYSRPRGLGLFLAQCLTQ